MRNPWLSLPEVAPFVLESDKQSILDFNRIARPYHQIHLEELPEPYTGNPLANIILLNLNPGFYKRNELFRREGGDAYTYFVKANRANLIHGYQEYPFYHLDPNNKESPGYYWWSRKLKQLISRYEAKKVASEVCAIEYFPYLSEHFGCDHFIMPSQRYTFHLVEEALKRNACVIVMRRKNLWERAIPLLKDYHYFTLKVPQVAAISEKNCPDGYREIVKMLG